MLLVQEGLQLTYHSSISRNLLTEVENEISILWPSGRVSIRPQSPHFAHDSWEWFLPATVVIYIADKFLSGFLEELGADTSKALKEAIKHLFNDLKDHKIPWTVAKPLDAEHRPILSVPFSIKVQQFQQVEATTTFVFLAKMDQSSIIPALEGLPGGRF